MQLPMTNQPGFLELNPQPARLPGRRNNFADLS
jgi:hypothetical protein